MLRAYTALLVTLIANVATVSFAARNNLKAERTSTVDHVMNQIGALLQTRGGSSGAVLDNLRALITPGATESLNEALTKVISEIETKVESKIKAGHQDTRVAIDQKIGDLTSATTQAVDEKTTADGKDGAWFDCVSEEKAKRVAVEEADVALKRAQEARIAPCQLQEDRKMYNKDPNAEEYKFGCDISEHGNCDPQMKEWEAEIDSLLSGVQSGAVEATGLWTEAKHACDAAKAEVVAREEALAAATSAWQKQRAHCMTEHESRQIAMCVFGTDLQRKCEKAKAYSNLMAEVDKVGGGEYSHPDRVTEWKGIAVTKCMISKVVAGEEINSATLDVCEQSINFDADVGILDRKQAAFADHTSPAKFTCKESSITFGGQTWTVPDGDAPASSEYVVKPFHPAVGLAAETAPFAFCESGKPEPPTPEPPTPEPPALETPAPEPPAPEPPTARPCTPTPNSAPAWNNVHVGNSRQVVKTVNLPASGMVCDSIAQNAQNPRWNDRFEVTINGKELSVKRLDVNHGWGQQLVLRCQEPHGEVVMVGNSGAVVKTVRLPAGGMTCEPTAVNKQADWWQDRFEVTIEGDQLSVQRLDVNHGWGQRLEISCRCGGSNLMQSLAQVRVDNNSPTWDTMELRESIINEISRVNRDLIPKITELKSTPRSAYRPSSTVMEFERALSDFTHRLTDMASMLGDLVTNYIWSPGLVKEAEVNEKTKEARANAEPIFEQIRVIENGLKEETLEKEKLDKSADKTRNFWNRTKVKSSPSSRNQQSSMTA